MQNTFPIHIRLLDKFRILTHIFWFLLYASDFIFIISLSNYYVIRFAIMLLKVLCLNDETL